jgi:hypothetical protein
MATPNVLINYEHVGILELRFEYILNVVHIMQDELMAWWSATSKDNIKIPSEEDLRVKVKKKRMLGLL